MATKLTQYFDKSLSAIIFQFNSKRTQPTAPTALMLSCLVAFLVLACCSSTSATYYGYKESPVKVYLPQDILDEFAGQPFCELPARLPHLPQCCTRRVDDCSRFVRKYNWTCYCDEFCETPQHSDCCPDYRSYCKGELKNNCLFNGRRYEMNQEVKQNCNLCKCTKTGTDLNWRCDNEVCLVRSDLIDAVNDLNRDGKLGWKAANYSFFWGKTLREGLNERLGTLLPSNSEHAYKTVHHDLRRFHPERGFDWRKEQRVLALGGLHPVRDQQNCNVSYAFSTTAVLSDRLTIHKREMLRKRVAPQFLISCLAAYNRTEPSEAFCTAKDIYAATGFLRQFESVSEGCFPVFLPHQDAAGYSRQHSLERWCLDFVRQSHRAQRESPNYRGDVACPKSANVARERKATATPWVLIKPEEKQIQYEIKRNGPVIAVFNVREDLFLYKSGIYEYSRASDDKPSQFRQMGLHSVRVVGWGEETAPNGRTYKYWIADNSWGTHWGENGYFRIARFCNPDCGIERLVMTAAAGTLHQHRIGLGSRRSAVYVSGNLRSAAGSASS